MNVLYVNIRRRSIFSIVSFFFSLFCEKFSRKRGNSYSYSLRGELFALWSILLVGVIFLAEQKLHKRGRKIAQRGFSLTIHVLCFFLVGIYIYIFFFLVWFTFCYFGNEIFVGDTKICFLVQYWSKVAKREMRAKKGGTIDQTFQYKLLVYLYRWINSWIWPNVFDLIRLNENWCVEIIFSFFNRLSSEKEKKI